MLEKAPNQDLNSQAAKAMARPPARMHVVGTGTLLSPWLLGTDSSKTEDPVCWEYVGINHQLGHLVPGGYKYRNLALQDGESQMRQ
jgi:hypothetical protein